jgi:hypothetical protein
VGLITMLSMRKLGASGIAPYCQIIYDRDDSWIDWVFYTAPSTSPPRVCRVRACVRVSVEA